MNQLLIHTLENVSKTVRNNKFKYRAYTTAIKNIQNYDLKILSGKQAREEIPGIGKSIAEKIDEILKTGSLELLERDKYLLEKDNICKLFEGIHGVGIKTSEKWYELGYRTLHDLKNEKMTDAQSLGYKYYYHINQKIPRDEMNLIKERLDFFLNCEYKICGSYRRGCKESGDIDILIKWQEGLSIDILIKDIKDLLVGDLSKGDKKYMGICRLGQNYNARRLDMLMVKPEEWPFATLYFTGSKKLNVSMRQKAIDMKMSLSEYSLTGYTGEIKTEQDIFNALNIDYLIPEDR